MASEDDWYLCKKYIDVIYFMRENIDLHCCCSCCLLLLLLWHICISDVTSSLVWPLPGTIPQFRDNTIGLRPKDTLQLNKTKQEYKYYTECMRAIISANDARIILKRPRCYPHNRWRCIKLVNLNLDYRRICASLGLNELRPRKIMNCQSPGDFLIKLVF